MAEDGLEREQIGQGFVVDGTLVVDWGTVSWGGTTMVLVDSLPIRRQGAVLSFTGSAS